MEMEKKMTSLVLICAAILTVFIGVVHSWLGERRLIGPLLSLEHRSGMLASSIFARNILRFAWHLTTLTWWGIAAILVALSLSPLDETGRAILVIVAVTFGLLGTVTFVAGSGRHLAWIVFLMIAGLSLVPLF